MKWGDEDHDRLARIVYTEHYRVHPRERQECRWVMSPEMLERVRELSTSFGQPLLLDMTDTPVTFEYPLVLLDNPVEIREDIEGIHLERKP